MIHITTSTVVCIPSSKLKVTFVSDGPLMVWILKWYGINPLELIEARKMDEIYGKDCGCKFDPVRDFKCHCGWNQNITLIEEKSFQDFRIVSKLRINGQF